MTLIAVKIILWLIPLVVAAGARGPERYIPGGGFRINIARDLHLL
jgi:hypothetical protein